MQRLFSMFPSAAPGFALLLLRISAAASLHFDQTGRFAPDRSPLLTAALIVLSLALLLGIITPVAAFLTAAFELAALLLFAGDFYVVAGLDPLRAVALGLLGPGAYSLDAHLFGRRVLVLPRVPHD